MKKHIILTSILFLSLVIHGQEKRKQLSAAAWGLNLGLF